MKDLELFKAQFEMAFQDKFDEVLLNEDLDKSTREAQRMYDEFKKLGPEYFSSKKLSSWVVVPGEALHYLIRESCSIARNYFLSL